jgi:hypothetical protein
MANRATSIPAHFDADFLNWFRSRLEASWASLPQRTPEEVLAAYVQRGAGGCAWQQGTRWLDGLSEEVVSAIERQWRLNFPPDYRLFLQQLHSLDRPMLCAGYLGGIESLQSAAAQEALAKAYVEQFEQYMALYEGASFYNWITDTSALEARFAWLWEGLQFDAEHNDLWLPSWGTKPATLEAQQTRIRELVEEAPRLIPVFGHRYLLAKPCVSDNPVFSIWQSDIIVYGAGLRDYFLFEFSEFLGLDAQKLELATSARVRKRFLEYQGIPFWGELLTR